jgi:hypothetical protein
MGAAAAVVFTFAALAVLGGWFAFRRVALPRPPLGVMSLGDVAVMLVAIVLVPFVYLAVPLPLVAGFLLLAAGSGLITLFTSLFRSRWIAWVATLLLLGADVAGALFVGPSHWLFFAINNTVLVLLIVSITVLWAQSGLRARDAAVLGAALTVYDLIATTLFPLTGDLIARLAALPLAPVVGWGTGDAGGWVGVGLGDLLMATTIPLVLRKAFGRTAGLAAVALGLGTIAGLLGLGTSGLLQGTFPVMVVLGPLTVLQYAAWRAWHGAERTTWQYLQAEPTT